LDWFFLPRCARRTAFGNLIELVESGADASAIRSLLEARRPRLSGTTTEILTLIDALPEDSLSRRLLGGTDVHRLIADEENLFFSAQLRELLSRFGTHEAAIHSDEPRFAEVLRTELRKILKGKVPAEQISSRIDDFVRTQDATTLRRALGQLSFDEMKGFMHGGNPLQPSPESLLGQFLSETGASSVVRRFKKHPDSDELGARTSCGGDQ
jgi:hypothetical protein